LSGALAHALKTELTQQEREELAAFAETLPAVEENPGQEEQEGG